MLIKQLLFALILLLSVAIVQPVRGFGKSAFSKPRVILDADLDSDVDDMGALAMLLNMHKAGTIDLIGVIVTSDDPFAPSCASAMNTFYGFPDIPIGYLKVQPMLKNHSRYTKLIAQEFPHKLPSWRDAEEAVSLYRKLLSQSAGESVVVVTIGHLSSLQKLLQSKPDLFSSLSGEKLVKQKVSKWICMGGQFPKGKEANFYRPDPQSTIFCVQNWKKEVVFCGWEVGNKVITGGSWLKSNLDAVHPLFRGYELYNNFAGRPSWDQIAVLVLTNRFNEFFTTQRGNCIIEPDGSNSWENNPRGQHKCLMLRSSVDVQVIAMLINGLMAGSISLSCTTIRSR